jgi:uncharacterized protein (DUF305 family)
MNKMHYARLAAMVVLSFVSMYVLIIREQLTITDKQFLRSMIPHRAGAILMCEKAPTRDPEVKNLCAAIVSNQQSEIDQMKAKLAELER